MRYTPLVEVNQAIVILVMLDKVLEANLWDVQYDVQV